MIHGGNFIPSVNFALLVKFIFFQDDDSHVDPLYDTGIYFEPWIYIFHKFSLVFQICSIHSHQVWI
jgi:Sec-independent protein secretion pathway component TatC